MDDKEYIIPPAPRADFGDRAPLTGLTLVDTTPVVPMPTGRKNLTWGTVEWEELKSIFAMTNNREKGDAFRNFIARLREADVDIRHEVWHDIEADPILMREVRRMKAQADAEPYYPKDNALYRKVVKGSPLDTNMRILGFDQSFTSSGIVVLDGIGMIHCEKFVSNVELDIFSRAYEVAEYVCKVANDHGCEVVAVEGLAFSKNGNATRDLAGLQFVIVTKLREEGYEVQVIPPNTVKKTATGKGNSGKPEMCEELPPGVRLAFDSLGVKKTTGLYDLSDAYWIAKSVDLTVESEVRSSK